MDMKPAERLIDCMECQLTRNPPARRCGAELSEVRFTLKGKEVLIF
jgi:hypothetical protein